MTFDASRWARACSDDVCLRYYKWCGRQADRHVCHYTRADHPYPNWLTLSALSEPAIWQAERKLGVILNDQVIPLTAFDTLSQDERPPQHRSDRPRL